MKPTNVIWPLDPHTRGKHEVLRRYLDAWFPILGSAPGRILFVDGFAGPGEYANGEKGSPLVALDALRLHRAKLRAEVIFLFIEEDEARAAHLSTLIERHSPPLPPRTSAHVITGQFDATMIQALDDLDAQRQTLAPAFVMVDPFGVSGTPMSVLERILRNPKAELYVSFMYEAINRWKRTPEFERHLDDLFGTGDWRKGLELASPERKDFFYGLYEGQLRRAGGKHVLHFDLYEGNRLVYAVFFATGHWMGADRMKQAIWKVAPGDFEFHGTRSSQMRLGLDIVDTRPLQTALQTRFRGTGWVTIEQITEFVGGDRTDFHTGHLKKQTLVPMELQGLLEAQASTGPRRRNSYPPGTRIRFL